LVNINIEIPDELHKKIKVHCALNDITLKDFIIDTLNSKFDKTKDKKKLSKG
jgi:predicted HicB family RNase H-like nuclease